VRDFRQLQVWRKSHQLTLAVYAATADFPKEEAYGLTGQIRRASASIPANIAEGYGRTGGAELARFLQIAMGSASELEYHLLLTRDLGYLLATGYDHLHTAIVEVKKMLATFIKRLRSDR
jgi:four helix bundle protein